MYQCQHWHFFFTFLLPASWPFASPWVGGVSPSLNPGLLVSSFSPSGFWGVPSMPGNDAARFLKSNLTFIPAFALVSMKWTRSSSAFDCPSSVATCLFSASSILFPTRKIMRSSPRIERAWSIHPAMLSKLYRYVMS